MGRNPVTGEVIKIKASKESPSGLPRNSRKWRRAALTKQPAIGDNQTARVMTTARIKHKTI
jgi:hypothetical protein